MIKHVKTALLVLAGLAASATAAFAQQMPPIPVDPEVRIGQLENGLTYYIRHNETPKGQADFYIAQKVGSILEEDNQRGLAHFLEHMCFNGTTNFPGNGIIDWLETKGVKFGQNLNAYTSVDQTVYNISNVPVASKAVQDSCLLILHDWANDLLLEPEEIDKERGVIHQEWRRSNVGQMRILETLLPTIYPNNRYGYRLPIGTMEVVDNFPYQALRDYYETWYRPDQQGVIVVGDIDVDYIEGKIKEMFSSIEMPANAPERVYFPVEDTEGTIYAIGSDPEQTRAITQLLIKADAIPNEVKTSSQYLMMQYMMNMVTTMLDKRLDEISKDPDAPFAGAGAGYSNFFLAKTKDAFTLAAMPKGEDDVVSSFAAAYRELLRASRGGFTASEYDRARAEYLSRLEKEYNGRDKRQNEEYVQEYVDNFLDNEPMPSVEDGYMIMTQIANMLPVEYINMVLPEYVTEDNRVLMCLLPSSFPQPTAADFEAAIAAVDAEDIEPYMEDVKTEPLIPNLPTPGKVTSVADDAQWGCKVVTLSNGVKVLVKTTDFKKDEIRFQAIAVGGTSAIGDDQATNLIFMPMAMMQSGLGDYNSTDLDRYLQGKQAGVSLSLDDYNRSLSGSTTVKDLPTLMELIYMTFVDYQITAEEYASTQKQIASVLANQEASPDFVFSSRMMKNFYTSAANQMITTEMVNQADREAILNIIHGMLANAADFTFVFVGDVDVETLTPLLEQYIATLPANAATASKDYVLNLGREIAPGRATDISTYKMQTPQTTAVIVIEGEMPYDMKGKVMSSMVGQVLSNRLLKKIREEMGAVYSIGAGSVMQRQGKYNTMIQIPFPMKPEMRDEVLAEISNMVEAMTESIAPEELNPIKEFMVKESIEDQELNSAWLAYISGSLLNGVDTFNGRVEAINSVTEQDLANFMKQLVEQNNYRVVVLDPEVEE